MSNITGFFSNFIIVLSLIDYKTKKLKTHNKKNNITPYISAQIIKFFKSNKGPAFNWLVPEVFSVVFDSFCFVRFVDVFDSFEFLIIDP